MGEAERRDQFIAHLNKYLPSGAADVIYEWIRKKPFHLKITKPRSSKLGDYRTPGREGVHRITVNGNLNKYAFLVTLVHEIAHMDDFMESKSLRNPHGAKWQWHYKKRFHEIASRISLPADILQALSNHLNSPAASSCADPHLLRTLRQYDEEPVLTLREVREGSLFTINGGKIFRKGELRRTRARCLDLGTNKHYLVHIDAEVHEVIEFEGKYRLKPAKTG